MTAFKRGDWLQWSTEYSVKRGEVIEAQGVSLKVRWLGGDEQVFPNVQCYVGPDSSDHARMVVIQRPKEASRIDRETRQGVISISGAAARLGTSPKRVRAMLRSGQLQGQQKDGRWTSVTLDE